LSDEPSIRTKTDVLDLIISFLMEHERRMDQTLQRLEGIVETLSRGARPIGQPLAPRHPRLGQPDAFTLTINNPNDFEDMRSLKIEWGEKRETGNEDGVVRKIERPVGKD